MILFAIAIKPDTDMVQGRYGEGIRRVLGKPGENRAKLVYHYT